MSLHTGAPWMDLRTVLTESKRIINAHTRHFLALSVLFLLPLCFSLTVYPTLQNLIIHRSSCPHAKVKVLLKFLLYPYPYPHHHHHRPDDDPSGPFPADAIYVPLIFSVFVFLYSLLAVGSITYSVLHGFYGRPVKLVSAVKSAFSSFFPLLITVLFGLVMVLGVFVLSGSFLFLVVKGIELVAVRVDYDSPYFTWFSVVCAVVLGLFLVYLLVTWALACVAVVVESSWGLQPLKRSSFLMKGMKRVALSVLLFFGICAGVLLWTSSVSGTQLGNGSSHGWKSGAFVVQIVVTSTFLMLLFLYYVAANTVLYVYCKAFHGELAWQVCEDYSRDYYVTIA